MKIIIIIGMLFSFLSAEDYTPEGFITMAKGLGWTSENCSLGTAIISTLDYEKISLNNAILALDINSSQDKIILVLRRNIGRDCVTAVCKKQHSN